METIEHKLQTAGVQVSEEAVDNALKLLQIYAIFERVDNRYHFIPQAFPDILQRTQSVQRLLRQTIRTVTPEN